jgi:hypothetical protein
MKILEIKVSFHGDHNAVTKNRQAEKSLKKDEPLSALFLSLFASSFSQNPVEKIDKCTDKDSRISSSFYLRI